MLIWRAMPGGVLDPGGAVAAQQRLAAALRIFGKFGFDEGVAGHITVRDPIETDTFWVNRWAIIQIDACSTSSGSATTVRS